MPRLYKRKARQDIYEVGLTKTADNKQGYILDKSKPSPSGSDRIIVKAGQEYYTWHPKGSPWQYSLEKPDLRSAWDKEISEWEEKIADLESREDEDDEDDYETDKEALRTELEERKDELDTNLDQMPEQLQESSILNERIEELEGLLGRLD